MVTLDKSHFTIILVEPSKPQNLGSISRLMMNFGFQKLILVNPQLSLAAPEVEIVARRSIQILNRAEIRYSTLQELRNEFELLIGTTARIGSDYNLNRITLTPEEVFTNEFQGNSIGLVFGREQYGLTNEEIDLCDFLVYIPTEKKYPVLNLSHALSILLYSVQSRIHSNKALKESKKPKHRLASFKEREQLKNYFNQMIKNTDYHSEKKDVANKAFSNILSRGYVSGREVTTLMGIFKWVNFKLEENAFGKKKSEKLRK